MNLWPPLPHYTLTGRKWISVSLPRTYFSAHTSLAGTPSYTPLARRQHFS